MADKQQQKIDVNDPKIQELVRIEVRKQLQVIEAERAVAQYFQQQFQGIVYSSFIRFVFKLDEYLKGTRDVFNVGLWYLAMICASVISSVYIQSHLLRNKNYARFKTALEAIGVVLQYTVQIYFMLLVSLITGTIDLAARDIDWLTLEISTVAVCIAIGIMLSNAFFSFVKTPSNSENESSNAGSQTELVSELITDFVVDRN